MLYLIKRSCFLEQSPWNWHLAAATWNCSSGNDVQTVANFTNILWLILVPTFFGQKITEQNCDCRKDSQNTFAKKQLVKIGSNWHKHLTCSFYARRSQKCKKTLTTWQKFLHFWDLQLLVKSWWNWHLEDGCFCRFVRGSSASVTKT